MRVTFLTHFRAPIYPGKGSLSMLQAGGFFFPPSAPQALRLYKNSHLRDVQHSQVFYCPSANEHQDR